MSFRQFIVCLIVGPFCAAFFVAALPLAPLFLLIGLLAGDEDPVMAAWEMVSLPPIWIFKEFYLGEGASE